MNRVFKVQCVGFLDVSNPVPLRFRPSGSCGPLGALRVEWGEIFVSLVLP